MLLCTNNIKQILKLSPIDLIAFYHSYLRTFFSETLARSYLTYVYSQLQNAVN
jgi:hypothetical protein